MNKAKFIKDLTAVLKKHSAVVQGTMSIGNMDDVEKFDLSVAKEIRTSVGMDTCGPFLVGSIERVEESQDDVVCPYGVPEIGSFKPFVSPVSGKMINNRSDLTNHNRRYDVEQVGNEYNDRINNLHEERQQ